MNRKILFVDDDEVFLTVYREVLRRDFDVHTAHSGSEALERVRTEGPFAVIISDLRMPDMDGLDFLARVNRLTPNAAKIMLTGHANLDSAMKAVNEVNVFAYFCKSCSSEELIAKVHAALEHYRKRMADQGGRTRQDVLTREEIDFLTRGR